MSAERPLVGVQLDSLVGLTEPKAPDVYRRQIDELGIEITTVSTNWGDIEKDNGVWDWSRLEKWDEFREQSPRPLVPLFLIFPVHMNERGALPADLKDEPFTSTKLLDRWDAFIAEAAKRGEWDDARAIVTVGNEIDWFIGVHPEEAEGAIEFLDQAAQSVTRHAPNARPMNTLQYGVLNQPWGQDVIDALNRSTSLVSFTWYDINERIEVPDPPNPVDAALSAMEQAAGGKPVLVQEFSMATGALNQGSEQRQAARVHEMFDALERRTRQQVEGLVWLTIEDWPRDEMRRYVDFQFDGAMANSDVFFEFLVTLGIAHDDGSPKPAYEAWMERIRRYR
jgi:hypothetical protein